MKIPDHMRGSILVLGVLLWAAPLGGAKIQERECCRNPETAPVYQSPNIHPDPTRDSWMINMSGAGGETQITIRVANRVSDPYWRTGEFQYLRTSNDGASWSVLPLAAYSPSMSPTTDLIMAPSNGKILYRKVDKWDGYARSEDGGETWRVPNYNIDNLSQKEFTRQALPSEPDAVEGYFLGAQLEAVQPNAPLTVYTSFTLAPWGLRFGSLVRRARQISGIFVSRDGGETWRTFDREARPGSPVGISASNPRVMMIDSVSGLLKSEDGGATWISVEIPKVEAAPVVQDDPEGERQAWGGWNGPEITQIVFDPHDERVIYVVANKGVYRSADGGNTWCLLNLGFDEIEAVRNLLVNSDDPKEIAIGTVHGILLSSDEGCHFRWIFPSQK